MPRLVPDDGDRKMLDMMPNMNSSAQQGMSGEMFKPTLQQHKHKLDRCPRRYESLGTSRW